MKIEIYRRNGTVEETNGPVPMVSTGDSEVDVNLIFNARGGSNEPSVAVLMTPFEASNLVAAINETIVEANDRRRTR